MDNIVTESIKFESEPNYLQRGYHLFDISFLNGLTCVITNKIETDEIHLKIKLDWDERDIEKITGFIQLSYDGHQLKPIDSNFDKRGGICTIIVPKFLYEYRWSFSFNLKLHRDPAKPPQISNDLKSQVSYDTMFEPSRKHDAVLLIGEKKLHVNKAFLSYHSDYFSDLFAEKVDEKNGIPIENVTYENFGLLMSVIYPEAVFSNHQNAEVLLELGNRFKIPAVMRHVENQIVGDTTKFPNKRLISLAEKYGLQKLLAMEIQKMKSFDQAKKFKGSDDYLQLSDATKAKIFDRLIELS